MKKLIITAILSINLFANQCYSTADRVSELVATEIEYLGNGLDEAFCANYDLTLYLLIGTKNICKNEPKVYESIDKVFKELNQVKYKIKCKFN